MINLINIKTNSENITLSARELYEFLEVKTRYNDWFIRMIDYGFEENVDYIAMAQKRATAQGNETIFVYDVDVNTKKFDDTLDFVLSRNSNKIYN